LGRIDVGEIYPFIGVLRACRLSRISFVIGAEVKMKRRVLLILGMLATGGMAGDHSRVDAKGAFERIKSLAGEWRGSGDKAGEHLTYEVIAGGSSVIERDGAEGRPPMLTVYHLDGDRLLLTHYCMAGNQPRMEAREFDAKTGRLHFDFLDATNLANKDAGHMHTPTLYMSGADRLGAEWVYYVGGKATRTERFEFTRVR
jgi:hypothetical protein